MMPAVPKWIVRASGLVGWAAAADRGFREAVRLGVSYDSPGGEQGHPSVVERPRGVVEDVSEDVVRGYGSKLVVAVPDGPARLVVPNACTEDRPVSLATLAEGRWEALIGVPFCSAARTIGDHLDLASDDGRPPPGRAGGVRRTEGAVTSPAPAPARSPAPSRPPGRPGS